MEDELVTDTIELPSGGLKVAQPLDSADLPDDGGVEWAPLLPYWSVLWRSGVALARALDVADLAGARVLELGCGLGLPSVVAARAGATVWATDAEAEGLELVAHNAKLNDVALTTATVDWAEPHALLELAPFDLVIAADVLYEYDSVGPLLALLPRLAPEALIADPGRGPAQQFFERAANAVVETETGIDGIVTIRRLRFG